MFFRNQLSIKIKQLSIIRPYNLGIPGKLFPHTKGIALIILVQILPQLNFLHQRNAPIHHIAVHPELQLILQLTLYISLIDLFQLIDGVHITINP